MIIRIYRQLGKTTLENSIKYALAECQRDHGVAPDSIGCRIEDVGSITSIAGIPVAASSSGIYLHAGEFEFVMPEAASVVGSIGIVASVESSVVSQMSLF